MTFPDLVSLSASNLRRLKLRTTLTVLGILIAIAAFITVASFGAGAKANVEKQFNELGLLSTMQVYPKHRPGEAAASGAARLDGAALERIARVPGVLLVYPFDAFGVSVRLGDSTFDSRAQALSHAAMATKMFSGMRAGGRFAGDSARSAIISTNVMKRAGVTDAAALIGKTIIVSVKVSTIDSALAHLITDRGESVIDRIKKLRPDSLIRSREYRTRVLRREANEAVRRFINGFVNARRTLSDTLTVCGVIEADEVGRVRMEPVIIPVGTAGRFSSGGMSGDPSQIFAMMTSGNLFAAPEDPTGKEFQQATVNFDPNVLYAVIKDSVEAQGFRTFSFAEQFEQIQKSFVYLNLALGAIGLMALFTASLGIVNTMLMSILERKREIGIFKSLGADEGEIRLLFLVESGVIGFLGAVTGIAAGWVITQIVTAIAHVYMRREGIPELTLFAHPLWLQLAAIIMGVGVAVVAGLYPASRAARVDPVEALRNE